MSPMRMTEFFPPDAFPHVEAIHAKLTAVQNESGNFAASARAMSDEDAEKVAEWIRQLYFRVHAASGADVWLGSGLVPPDEQ